MIAITKIVQILNMPILSSQCETVPLYFMITKIVKIVIIVIKICQYCPHNAKLQVPENCPFVLTSPRSLQACQLAGIKVRFCQHENHHHHHLLACLHNNQNEDQYDHHKITATIIKIKVKRSQ